MLLVSYMMLAKQTQNHLCSFFKVSAMKHKISIHIYLNSRTRPTSDSVFVLVLCTLWEHDFVGDGKFCVCHVISSCVSRFSRVQLNENKKIFYSFLRCETHNRTRVYSGKSYFMRVQTHTIHDRNRKNGGVM